MNLKEEKVYMKTKIRNLKRKHAKLIQHAELIDETLEVEKEIQSYEKQLEMLQ
ncbi:hypothetical protein [Methanobrevibacter sp.]|uniref:hypothetical protein n=1 Tax=Methanobrevibacter sp. TaxID=66852 RepID=UPI0025F51CBA|nr:hypothetical protein [Methanobrevibacter sp.]MBQ2832901.1 hypothetical protein [Methanobrevibacter sp.]